MPTPESAVFNLTDLHTGKETKSFNVEVLKRRLNSVFQRVTNCIKIEKNGHIIRKLYLLFGGDIIDGMMVYKTHPHHVDKQAAFGRAQVNLISQILITHIEKLVADLDMDIEIHIVPGNHGRTSFFDHEMNNYDLWVGDNLALYFTNNPRVKVVVHNDFYGYVKIEGWGFVVYHGASIRAYQTIPWYGIIQRLMRWAGAMSEPFTYLIMGHWHTYGWQDWNDKRVLLNGTLVTDDDWALETLGLVAINKFHLFGVHPKNGITWHYDIDAASEAK